ncbi:hypothetical protein AB0F81_50695 [Actinoplanes sp. NPDC024001]|uniref:hypothetical protein n=1 Tax=Actinoplanes sp. NPDC024001 TaxID=3154598 RepID=UPI0033C7696D
MSAHGRPVCLVLTLVGTVCRSVGLCVPPTRQIVIWFLRAGEVERHTEMLYNSLALFDCLLRLLPRRQHGSVAFSDRRTRLGR